MMSRHSLKRWHDDLPHPKADSSFQDPTIQSLNPSAGVAPERYLPTRWKPTLGLFAYRFDSSVRHRGANAQGIGSTDEPRRKPV